MSPRIITTAAAIVGGAAAALLGRQLLRRRRNRAAASSLHGDEPIEAVLVYDDAFDLDDLDELTVAADATVIAEAEAVAESETLIVTSLEDVTDDGRGEPDEPAHLDHDRASAHGETWLEALQEDAVENGPGPESVLVFRE